jgi:putative membrane protein
VNIAAIALTAVVAALHVYFMLLEMVFWRRPLGMRIFGNTPEKAETTAVLAANQGLYNGFLVAGLVWSLVGGGFPVRLFFLACVIVAGVFGGLTASRRILAVQALPAVLALAASYLAR